MKSCPGSAGKRCQRWDRAGRRVEIDAELFQDRVREDGYDPLENITKRETTIKGKKSEADYEYNFLQQLVAERGRIEHEYVYDSIGNRLRRGSSPFKVNALNQLIEAEGITYTYDLNGNLVTKTTAGGTWIYKSNALNQIVLSRAQWNLDHFHL